MPYRTKFGSHYHEEYGCHGATIPCDSSGLMPCSDCCGRGTGSGTQSPSGNGTGLSGGAPARSVGDTRQDGDRPVDSPDADEAQSRTVGETLSLADELADAGVARMADAVPAPSGEIDPGNLGEDVGRIEDGIRQQFGYRSELLFGQGYTEAPVVMAYETFVLENTDILLHLGEGILAGTEAGERMTHIASVMSDEEDDPEVDALLERCRQDQDECPEGRAFFSDVVLPAIKEKTGHDIRHVLWLCDCPEDVIGAYGTIEDIGEDDIDEHEVGVMTLSDIGEDGKLWGYEHEIERPDLDMWW